MNTSTEGWNPRLVAATAVIMLLSMVAALEYSLIYPAIRYMVPEFHTPNVAWAVTILSLTGVATESLIGKLADMYGRKRVLLVIMAIFAIGSVVCAVAPNLPILLIGRVLQGTFLAITGLGYSLLRDALPPRLIPVGLGILSTGLGLSNILGVFAGGSLIDSVGFRAVFWFLLAYILVLVPPAIILVPDSPVRERQRLDILGALLISVGFGLIFLVITKGEDWGWTSATSLLWAAVGVVTLVAFVLRGLRIKNPMIDIRMAFGRRMRTALVATTLATFVLGCSGYLTPLMLETPRGPGLGYGFGLGALAFAVYQLPQGLATVIFGPLGGMLARSRNSWLTLQLGLGSLALSMILMALFHTHTWQVVLWPVFFGLGLAWAALGAAKLIVEAVPHGQTAVSTGVMGVVRSLGSGASIPVLGAILAHHVHSSSGDQVVYTNGGFTTAFLVAGAAAVLGMIVVALGRRTSRAADQAEPAPTLA